MMVKDAMILIHLAKLTLLEKSCKYFEAIAIPEEVYREVSLGKGKRYPEVNVIMKLIESKKIIVKKVTNKKLVKKAEEFNVQRGEAEAVALYWQEKAGYLATDDNNVRKKSLLLEIKIIGTPAIIMKLYKKKYIDKEKFNRSLVELRRIGWFSNAVIDTMRAEG